MMTGGRKSRWTVPLKVQGRKILHSAWALMNTEQASTVWQFFQFLENIRLQSLKFTRLKILCEITKFN